MRVSLSDAVLVEATSMPATVGIGPVSAKSRKPATAGVSSSLHLAMRSNICSAPARCPLSPTLQPFGQIPTYEEDDLILFESGAIVMPIGWMAR
jgi:hypothetical protein